MSAATPDQQDKFRRYRARKKAQGLKEVRMWLPNWDSAEFKAEMERAAVYFARLENDSWITEFGNQCLVDMSEQLDRLESRSDS